MSFSALEYLRHILDETKYLLSEKEKSGQDEFLQDETLRRALGAESRAFDNSGFLLSQE